MCLAVPDRFDDWRAERNALLESRLREVDALATAGKLTEAVITAEGLSISPIRASATNKTDGIALRLYGMLPCRVCASPNFSPKCMAGRASPIDSAICGRERHPRIEWR